MTNGDNSSGYTMVVQSDKDMCLTSRTNHDLHDQATVRAITSDEIFDQSEFSQERNKLTHSNPCVKEKCSKRVTFDKDTQVHAVPLVSKDEKHFFFYSKQELQALREEYVVELRSEYEFFQYHGLFKWNQFVLSFYVRFREFLKYHISTFFCFNDHGYGNEKVNKVN
jgi:hypothetical protein